MNQKIYLVIAFLVVLPSVNAFAQGMDNGKGAVVAAETWLALVDAGRNVDSWKEAGGYFKRAVKQDQWEQSLQGVRQPLGQFISRNLSSKVYTKSLPGAPDGEYLILQFESAFQNKKSALETVTCVKEKDGHYRVAGYYIK